MLHRQLMIGQWVRYKGDDPKAAGKTFRVVDWDAKVKLWTKATGVYYADPSDLEECDAFSEA